MRWLCEADITTRKCRIEDACSGASSVSLHGIMGGVLNRSADRRVAGHRPPANRPPHSMRSTRSSGRSCAGCPGSTTSVYSAPSGSSHPPNTKPTTTVTNEPRPPEPESTNEALRRTRGGSSRQSINSWQLHSQDRFIMRECRFVLDFAAYCAAEAKIRQPVNTTRISRGRANVLRRRAATESPRCQRTTSRPQLRTFSRRPRTTVSAGSAARQMRSRMRPTDIGRLPNARSRA